MARPATSPKELYADMHRVHDELRRMLTACSTLKVSPATVQHIIDAQQSIFAAERLLEGQFQQDKELEVKKYVEGTKLKSAVIPIRFA